MSRRSTEIGRRREHHTTQNHPAVWKAQDRMMTMLTTAENGTWWSCQKMNDRIPDVGSSPEQSSEKPARGPMMSGRTKPGSGVNFRQGIVEFITLKNKNRDRFGISILKHTRMIKDSRSERASNDKRASE